MLSSSRTAALTCLRYLADIAMARVMAGSATLWTLIPVAITGKIFRRIEKKYIKSRATKKLGILFPRKLAVLII